VAVFRGISWIKMVCLVPYRNTILDQKYHPNYRKISVQLFLDLLSVLEGSTQLQRACEYWVFSTRFIVFLCGKISDLNVVSFYNYYKSNSKRLATPSNLTKVSEIGIFENILFFLKTAYFFIWHHKENMT
jgi:hypothetical protein